MILVRKSGAVIKSLSKRHLQEESKASSQAKPNRALEDGFVLIIDNLGKLQSAKWRLMSDGIPFRYCQQIPSKEDLQKLLPGVIMMHLSAFQYLADALEDIRSFAAKHVLVVIGNKKEEKGLEVAFNQGAKAVFALPLDLPKISILCKKELGKRHQDEHSLSQIVTRAARIPQSHTEQGEDTLQQASGLRAVSTSERLVLNSLRMGILYLDSDGRVILANRAFKEQMRIKGRNLQGRSFLELCANKLQLEINNLINQSLKECRLQEDIEVIMPGAEDQPVPGLLNSQPVQSKTGQLMGLLITLEEHKTVKENQDRRFRSEKLAVAGQLAAGAVHEIKNPLTSVRGFIQLLHSELQDNPKAEYIDIIISEIDRVNNIVNEFLKLAKPANPKRTACSLTELFEEIRILMESEAFLKNVVLVEKYSHLPPMKIDKEQIKQVLINIIQNSFEAMPGGGRLEIKAQPLENEKQIRIEFVDTGCGISEEVMARIFEPFFTTKEQGTGLGLAVSQQILQSHGGYMELKSQRGKGTTTTLYLPY